MTKRVTLHLLGMFLLGAWGCEDGGRDAVAFVELPGGAFQMGSINGADDERPVHGVTVSAFGIATSETTQAQYLACIDHGACTEPSDDWAPDTQGDFPVTRVDWEQASAFCKWTGARLCTEAEWEYAARSGGEDRPYPWGDVPATPDCAVVGPDPLTNCDWPGTREVCSKPGGNSKQGACDLVGNVWEWVEDCYGAYEYGGQTTPTGSADIDCEVRVIRGGSWVEPALPVSTRWNAYSNDRLCQLGFRCCRSN
jgi:formylglycine-generating enzyme required for sulfatase activity